VMYNLARTLTSSNYTFGTEIGMVRIMSAK
jgi:hypothetical protein